MTGAATGRDTGADVVAIHVAEGILDAGEEHIQAPDLLVTEIRPIGLDPDHRFRRIYDAGAPAVTWTPHADKTTKAARLDGGYLLIVKGNLT